MIEKINRILANLLATLHFIPRIGRIEGDFRIGKRAAKVRDGAGPRDPSLLINEMAHVAPGVEWPRKSTHRNRRPFPSERFDVFADPKLKGLGLDGLKLRDHVAPPLVTLQNVLANERDRAESNSQHDEIEVARDVYGLSGGRVPIPMRFEFSIL